MTHHVDSTQAVVRLDHVSFSYPGQLTPLFEQLDLTWSPGWCGIVGANGAGKSTLLRLVAGLLSPDSGRVYAPGALYCAQRVEALGTLRDEVLQCWGSDAMRIRAILELDEEVLWRWETCSSGERKRWQVGHALMRNPEILLMDEPTNHLDAEAREAVRAALDAYHGTGMLVSHDRHLLDALTTQTLWIEGDGEVTWYAAPYTQAVSLREAERLRYLR